MYFGKIYLKILWYWSWKLPSNESFRIKPVTKPTYCHWFDLTGTDWPLYILTWILLRVRSQHGVKSLCKSCKAYWQHLCRFATCYSTHFYACVWKVAGKEASFTIWFGNTNIFDCICSSCGLIQWPFFLSFTFISSIASDYLNPGQSKFS